MRTVEPKSNLALGFLTVLEYPAHGLIGGYLVLNQSGRPLEFHCTAPIKPNRAQQILYGPTLEPYLFGEQIGRALLAKAAIEPVVICTDCEPALAVRRFIEVPVALVLPVEERPPEGTDGTLSRNASTPEDGPWRRLDAAHTGPLHHPTFHLGRNLLAVSALAAGDRELIANRLSELTEGLDLAEPFGRIREAIEEARRGGA